MNDSKKPENLPQASPTEVTRIAELLQKLPKNTPDTVRAELVSFYAEEIYSGPMPHPKHFREYNTIVPGIGQKMFDAVETQAAFRMQLTRDQQKIDRDNFVRGQSVFLPDTLGRASPVFLWPLGLWLEFSSLTKNTATKNNHCSISFTVRWVNTL
jgi:uncharacterized membrane protein